MTPMDGPRGASAGEARHRERGRKGPSPARRRGEFGSHFSDVYRERRIQLPESSSRKRNRKESQEYIGRCFQQHCDAASTSFGLLPPPANRSMLRRLIHFRHRCTA
ncbi:hypothetical protein SJA_C1-05650 [Sphingobium indicum UT26S]|uniref:Uncharacterized protein n=1 Tax=Sphingobium indicum (strain DSM 16413 / CCM 7287 / MTCC 6362 / UT26 / NBRC 101211 / UT26S) TaxID=452662 RepID=D4YYG7_SPHIU|nr:hypothetical protein SJA_C1-05650 [Sphingobium indicum UT26S]